MARGNTYTDDVLKLVFNATPLATIADDAAATPLTSLYVGLHTADPGAGGAQNTNEISYTSYARVAVARTTAGFTVNGQTVSFVDAVEFPASTGGTGGTATYYSIGTASTGTGKLLYSGVISPAIAVTTGVVPTISAASRAAPLAF